MMDDKRLRCILTGLKRGELTSRERQFVDAVERYFNEKGVLTDQQESILEGIYRERKWIRRTFLSQNELPKGTSSKAG